MFSEVVLLLLLSLNARYLLVHSRCSLKVESAQNRNWIYAFKENGRYALQRCDHVDAGQTLYTICTGGDIIQRECKASGELSPPLPSHYCNSSTKATLQVVPDTSCAHTMYGVGYQVANDFLELYRSCYDKSERGIRAHFTVHRLFDFQHSAKRPNQMFTTDYVISAVDVGTFTARSIYDRFKELLGDNQEYVRSGKEPVFNRGHLTPSSDFDTENNMRSTFKYINVVPQFGKINRATWVTIENWVRKLGSSCGSVKVCTGVIDILQLPNERDELVPMYLGKNINPIPKWMYKITSLNNNRYVFLVYNNIYDTQPPTPICQAIDCPKTIELSNSTETGFSFCCDPTDFLNRVVPNLKNIC